MRVGILMGGSSREREISFAGGRTIFDTLDRKRFQPVPIFIDALHRFILLEEQYLYRGTIKDFYPPTHFLPDPDFHYSVEHLFQPDEYDKIIQSVGQIINIKDLSTFIDFAFLTLHGSFAEDGTIQGLLEWLKIPYTGTGIFGSSLGMDKIKVRVHLEQNGFPTPSYEILTAHDWNADQKSKTIDKIEEKLGFPCVVKNPYQGSSIGISVAKNKKQLEESIENCFFIKRINTLEWKKLSNEKKLDLINNWVDVRTEIGLPAKVLFSERIIKSPRELLQYLENEAGDEVILEALDTPDQLLIESYLPGKEISVIVIEDENGQPVALPPTEIVKNQVVYDYHDKYLSGSVHKFTPARLPDEVLIRIQTEAERLAGVCGFQVFSRIDGILSDDQSTIYFNDPNTTSGMLPGSFLFHQAAEVGFTPMFFLTYLIETSLKWRLRQPNFGSIRNNPIYKPYHKNAVIADGAIKHDHENKVSVEHVAVIMGGYSSEKHISVESGRNIYQKIISAGEFSAEPIFLLHNDLLGDEILKQVYPDNPEFFTLWSIPIAILLKDNADDIAQKIVDSIKKGIDLALVVQRSRKRLTCLSYEYSLNQDDTPHLIRLDELNKKFNFIFIALHGRPGEDGYLKAILDDLNLPYNGSGVEASAITMDKFQTNKYLEDQGFSIPKHFLVEKELFSTNPEILSTKVFAELGTKLIAKPNDEGCSTDVMIISDQNEFLTYGQKYFQSNPNKNSFLVEELVMSGNDERLVEITIGFVSKIVDGKHLIQVFEPSETVSKSAVLSLEEKFLAGEGQNITPARLSTEGVNAISNLNAISEVKDIIGKAIQTLNLYGYARIDAFVVLKSNIVSRVIFIEVNSLPGMTPATCIFHQAALAGYNPYRLIRQIIQVGIARSKSEK